MESPLSSFAPEVPGADCLEQRFRRLWKNQTSAQSAWQHVRSAYLAPDRHFHNLRHIAECLAVADEIAALMKWPAMPVELELAIWFHDLVYQPGARSNEAKSAKRLAELVQPAQLAQNQLAQNQLAQPVQSGQRATGSQVVPDAMGLILQTATHGAEPCSLSAVMCDCDLWILGSPSRRYRAYAQAIRQEFGRLPNWIYRRGRSAFLRNMLARPRLFATRPLDEALSVQARDNISAELAELHR